MLPLGAAPWTPDVESIFTCAKAVEHVIADCIAARIVARSSSTPEIDFKGPRELPVVAHELPIANAQPLQPQAIIPRRDTDRWDPGGAVSR